MEFPGVGVRPIGKYCLMGPVKHILIGKELMLFKSLYCTFVFKCVINFYVELPFYLDSSTLQFVT